MGCDSRESNFNNHVYHDGKWWVQGGWDYTYQVPIGHLGELMDRLGEHVHKYDITVDEEHRHWVATPKERA